MTKKESDYQLKRIYKLLNDPETFVRLGKLQNPWHGVALPIFQSMLIDPRKSPLPTFIHECLHLLYPTVCETKILSMERGMINQMTQRQWRNVMVRFANKL